MYMCVYLMLALCIICAMFSLYSQEYTAFKV